MGVCVCKIFIFIFYGVNEKEFLQEFLDTFFVCLLFMLGWNNELLNYG